MPLEPICQGNENLKESKSKRNLILGCPQGWEAVGLDFSLLATYSSVIPGLEALDEQAATAKVQVRHNGGPN